MVATTSYTLLILGCLRTIAWAVGVGAGVYHKRILQTGVCAFASYSSTVFMLENAGVHIGGTFVNLAIAFGVPQVVGIVGVFAINSLPRDSRDKWTW